MDRPSHRPSTLRAYEDAVATVVARMRARPGEPLDLAAMSVLAGVSRCHFDRVFRAVTNLPPRQFQTALRLEAATRLLLETDRSVTDICFDVGYESLGSFVTLYTESFGMSPVRLRRLARGLREGRHEWPHAVLGAPKDRPTGPLVSGSVVGKEPFSGWIFLGLFAEPLPTRGPLACTVLRAPGPFEMHVATRRPLHAFAVGIAGREPPLAFQLDASTLRGSAKAPVTAPASGVEVELRPAHATDPPINVVLPLLVFARAGGSMAPTSS